MWPCTQSYQRLSHYWYMLSAIGYVVTTVKLNTADHFLPQNRERLWIMGYRTDMSGGATPSDIQGFLRATTTCLSKGNKRIGMNDVLLKEWDPSVARFLERARVAPVIESTGSKRMKWAEDNIERVGLDQWLSQRLHMADDMLQAFPGCKFLRPRHLDCLSTAGIDLPTEQNIVANVQGSTQYLSVSHDIFPTITPKGIFFLCNRVRQPYLIFCLIHENQ